MEYIVNSYFALDILMNFNTGAYKKGSLIMDRKTATVIYLKSWFLIDFFATVPF